MKSKVVVGISDEDSEMIKKLLEIVKTSQSLPNNN